MSFLGISPFGALAAGTLSDLIGARTTLTLGGLACMIAALVLARHGPTIRGQMKPMSGWG